MNCPLVALVCCLVAPPVRAQLVVADAPIQPLRGTSGPNLLTVNPADLFGGVASVEYERALTSWFGLTFGLQVRAFRAVYAPAPDPSFTGINPEVGVKFHFSSEAPAGPWAGLSVNAGAVLTRSDGAVTRTVSWGMGMAAGYTFVLERHLTFEFGLGGGFVDYGERVVWTPRLIIAFGSAF